MASLVVGEIVHFSSHQRKVFEDLTATLPSQLAYINLVNVPTIFKKTIRLAITFLHFKDHNKDTLQPFPNLLTP